ncbi:MAG TPA: hypothetical protein VME22_09530 [Solirubrobacteraceae bacterium]|nr:hypothetical protein [Solirubrobacteraceae bacterium]
MSALKTNGVSTEPVRAVGPSPTYATEEPSYKGAGWILFAALMFVIAAGLNVIWGIAAVSASHFFVANAHYILSDLNTWGWIAIGLGAVEALTAVLIWRRNAFGRWFGVALAGVATLVAMISIPAYPFWSLTLVALYVLVAYGLALYGGKPAR